MTLAIIPARAGSKGIPHKNIVDLCGKPLIAWTLDAAARSHISEIVVSTDCPQIADIAREHNCQVLPQPEPMCLGTVNAVNVCLNIIQVYADNKWRIPDKIMMLLPTSPLRSIKTINGALRLFGRFDYCPSVIGVTSGKPINSLRYFKQNSLVPIQQNLMLNIQRQDCEMTFVVNGAMYLAGTHTLKKSRTFHMRGAMPYFMPSWESIDINDDSDLLHARLLATQLETLHANQDDCALWGLGQELRGPSDPTRDAGAVKQPQ